MTTEQMRAVHASSITAARSELVLALDVAVRGMDQLRFLLDEARRERGVMQHLAQKNRTEADQLRREVDRLESAMRDDRRLRGVGW